jgi:hypothetical protein
MNKGLYEGTQGIEFGERTPVSMSHSFLIVGV